MMTRGGERPNNSHDQVNVYCVRSVDVAEVQVFRFVFDRLIPITVILNRLGHEWVEGVLLMIVNAV